VHLPSIWTQTRYETAIVCAGDSRDHLATDYECEGALTVLDVLLKNARVLTVDDSRPRAHTVGIIHDRIVGVDEDLDDLAAATVIDCQGAVVAPGFSDAHNHMGLFGLTFADIDLSTCATLEQLYDTVASRAALTPHGGWIRGFGYDSVTLGGQPERPELDRAGGGRPVWVRHRSAHVGVASSSVLQRLGLLDGTAEVPIGGRVVRDAHGDPTGELQEQAQALVLQLAGARSTDELTEAIARAARIYAAEGLTHVTEAGIGGGWIGSSPIEALAYQLAREQGRLPIRVELMVANEVLRPVESHPADQARVGIDLGLRTGFGDDFLRIGPTKIFIDGSMTARTGALTDLLCAHGDDHGLLGGDPDLMTASIVDAHAAGWRVAAHSIGDAAIDLALDAFEAAQRAHPRTDVRHRIEHAAVTRPDQIVRMARLGVVPTFQPRFVHEVGESAADWLGEQHAPHLLRHKSFVDAGLRVPGSSDRPVVKGASPLLGMQSMVERIGKNGRLLSGDERVDAGEALRAYTVNAAWASHAENRRGRIAPGLLADLVVLDDDPTTVPSSTIGEIGVLGTLVGGAVVHGEDTLDAWTTRRLPSVAGPAGRRQSKQI
jgi:predicted amidohydrolase YtcJ